MSASVIPFKKSRTMAKNAVLLARVSSKEQEEGYSIDAQNYRLLSYCERRELTVLKIFELVESSTCGDRDDFMGMIKYVKAQKGTVAIVADKVDRVQRSFKEYPLLDALVQEGKIELHFITENYIIHRDSVSQDRFMWSMGVIMAQSYIDNMKDNVKRSFDQKIRQGEWIALAPIGYKNVKDSRNRGDVIVDTDRAHLVKRIFETYATGAYTLEEIRQKTILWGLKNRNRKQDYLNKSQLHKLVSNPFYCGKMLIKGHLYTHRYETLISQDIFDKCQAVLKGWKKKPFLWAGKEFVFRGLLTCSVSGRMVTADTKKKAYVSGKTSEWTYLRCNDPLYANKKMWVREERILEQVASILKSISINPETLTEIQEIIEQANDVEKEFIVRQTTELQSEHRSIKNRIDKLTDLLIDGAIDRKEYDDRKDRLRIQLENVETLLLAHANGDDGFKEALVTLFAVASGAYETFIGSTVAQKRLVLNFVFANLSLKGDKLLYSLRKPFDQFSNNTKIIKWRDLIDKLRSDPYLRREILLLFQTHDIKQLLGVG